MHPTAVPIRRLAALAALAAAVVALVAVPAGASARSTCNPGDFCLYSQANLSGGLYHFSGSDSNLLTNLFENENTNEIVGFLAASAQNHGIDDPSHRNDVAVYPRLHFKGKPRCIRRGAGGNLRPGTIGSFGWVTRAACNSMESAIAARSPAA